MSKTLEENLKNHGIGWFRALAKDIEASEGEVYVYIRARIDFLADVFVIRGKIDVKQIAYGVTKHRARRLKRAVLDGTIANVNPQILENYITTALPRGAGFLLNIVQKQLRGLPAFRNRILIARSQAKPRTISGSGRETAKGINIK